MEKVLDLKMPGVQELGREELKCVDGGGHMIKVVDSGGVYLIDIETGEVFNIMGQKVYQYIGYE